LEVVDAAQKLAAAAAAAREDVADGNWLLGSKALAALLGPLQEGPTPADPAGSAEDLAVRLADSVAAKVEVLAADVLRVLQAQPTVVRVSSPTKVFGDVHGQLRDLLLLLAHHGFPSHRGGDVEAVSYVFNGDFVDRGAHQLEVVVVLFALKCLYPSRVFLVRGNHEFRSTNEAGHYGATGFRAQVTGQFEDPSTGRVVDAGCGKLQALPDRGRRCYDKVQAAFEWLPLAAVIDQSVLVLHGGIGSQGFTIPPDPRSLYHPTRKPAPKAGPVWGIKDLEAVQRPIRETFHQDARTGEWLPGFPGYPVCPPCVNDCLWSDPTHSDADAHKVTIVF